MNFIVLILNFSLLYFSGIFCQCNFPPSLWCSSSQIATDCNVKEACDKYLWSKRVTDLQVDRVNVTLYYESMCPDCKEFFVQELYKTFTFLSDIVTIDLIPYGNAKKEKISNGTVVTTCQHGKEECFGNIIQTCSIHIYGINKVMPFIYCMELSNEIPAKSAHKCSMETGLDYDEILSCATSKQGIDLENKMADRTDSLRPSHTYVPWILLNGIHTDEIQKLGEKNLMKLVCDTYKGSPPAECIKLLLPNRKCYKFNL